MMAMRRWMARFAVAAVLLAAGNAMAFPSWIGVYGDYQRHSTGNPGSFSILLNQDYYGLHAEVGVQVNGGAWTVYPMAYKGNVQGNSSWGYTPAAAFPAGATVNFYFHGYDNWGGNIWDSRNGQNYSFLAEGSSDGLTFSAGASLGFNGPAGYITDAAARGDKVYALASGGVKAGTVSTTGTTWNANYVNAGGQAIAANDSTVITVGASSNDLVVARSTDGGATFGAAVTLGNLNEGVITAYDIGSRGTSDFVIAFATTKDENGYPFNAHFLYVVRSTNNGQTWSAPIEVDTQEIMGFIDSIEVEANASKFFIKYRYMNQTYSVRIRVAQSVDGQAWTWDQIMTDKAGMFSSIVVGPEGAYVAMDPYYDNFTRFARLTGSQWELFQVPHLNAAYESGRGIRLARDGQGNVYLFRIQATPSTNYDLAKSSDKGATWYAVGTITPPAGVPNFTPFLWRALSENGRVNLVWINQDWRYGCNVWQVSLPRVGGPVQTIGNTYNWPLSGSINPTDDLWINTQTMPKGNAMRVFVVYTSNGVNWVSRDLDLETLAGASDSWHVNLGKFRGGAIVRYAVCAVGGDNVQKWDNNNGQDFRAPVIATGLVAPYFYKLDPYRNDLELVRVNGRAKDGNRSFGSFGPAETVTVATRPVENANGESAQFAVSMNSWVVYTTTPGDWSNAKIVYGTFHTAGLSNKPIFDFFSYDLGTFPAGSHVEFWVGAENSVGKGYAQGANQNYSFSAN